MEISPGNIIQEPRWPEPVEVRLAEDHSEYVCKAGAIRSRIIRTIVYNEKKFPIKTYDHHTNLVAASSVIVKQAIIHFPVCSKL